MSPLGGNGMYGAFPGTAGEPGMIFLIGAGGEGGEGAFPAS
jgi:hypothetical protein